jgi:hypothetical protein
MKFNENPFTRSQVVSFLEGRKDTPPKLFAGAAEEKRLIHFWSRKCRP